MKAILNECPIQLASLLRKSGQNEKRIRVGCDSDDRFVHVVVVVDDSVFYGISA